LLRIWKKIFQLDSFKIRGSIPFGADFVVRGGVDGFASGARAASLYVGNGLSSEFEDNAAAQTV